MAQTTAQRADNDEAPQGGNRPVAKFRHGGVELSVWTIQTAEDGAMFNTTISNSYKDDKSGEWKTTSSFSPTDLLVVGELSLPGHHHGVMVARFFQPTDENFVMKPENSNDKPPPRDYRKEVTDDIIKMLEEGTAPWQKPWHEGELGRTPFNPTTNRPYRGGNVLGLMIAGMRKGYTDPRWCTYKQAADNGWQVRKGEKATAIEFWEIGRGDKDDGESDANRPRSRMIHRVHSVFNAQQIDGIPALELPERKPFEAIEAGEKNADELRRRYPARRRQSVLQHRLPTISRCRRRSASRMSPTTIPRPCMSWRIGVTRSTG